MGLVLAHKLSEMEGDHQISILERDSQLGGLATYYHYDSFYWDKFYHVILPTDKDLLDFMADLGLEDEIRWGQTLTGVYVDHQFYSVSTTKEFLLFPPLNLWQKFRLGLTILIGSRINNWRSLEKVTVEEWLVRFSGKKTYEKFWKPLLLAKLGSSYKRVSAVFIWTYIKRLFEAREDSSARSEHMGYISGGYKTVLDHLEKSLSDQEVQIRLQSLVSQIQPDAKSGLQMKINGDLEHFDKVIFTGPVNVLHKVADPTLIAIEGKPDEVEYLGVICMVLVLKSPLTPYYVLNIADDKIPFTGVIGMSTLVDVNETDKKHLVYLPKYILSTDSFMKLPDAEVKSMFFEGLRRLYPDFDMESVISVHINRAFKVQPLQVINYSTIIPKVSTLHPDFFVLNTSQFVKGTLNNNSVTSHVNHFMKIHGKHFSDSTVEVLNTGSND